MWIEFFGPPGVGKTTTFREATRHIPSLSKRGQDGLAGLGDERSALRYAMRCPEWEAFVQHADNAFSRARDKRGRLKEFRRQSGQHWLMKRRSGLVLIDEFLCQRGISLAASWVNDWSDVDVYYRMMPLPPAVVVMRADPDTIRERNHMRARRGGREFSCYADVAIKAVETALPYLRGVPMLELDGHQSAEVNGARVVSFARTLE